MCLSARVCVLAGSPLACSVTFLPYRRSPSRGSWGTERDLLCCCRIPLVRIGGEVGGGLGDMPVVFSVDGEEEGAAG